MPIVLSCTSHAPSVYGAVLLRITWQKRAACRTQSASKPHWVRLEFCRP
jgi:hypothetical protein